MFGHTFYHNTIRKYVVLFGTLFNDIYIERDDTVHDVKQVIKVPISYGPKDKMLARVDADPEFRRPAIVLPRMSFEMTDLNYAPTRKLSSSTKVYSVDSEDPDKLKYQFTPVPYDFNFMLSIAVKNAEDGTRILEQILPFFTPQWTSTVNLIPEMGIKMDIPLVLTSVSSEDTYEGDFLTRRALVWTLTFTMKGYIFGPIVSGGVIKLANTNFYDASSFDTASEAVGSADVLTNFEVEPGLLANGSPTSNSTLTVNSNLISANSNYGYIVTRS